MCIVRVLSYRIYMVCTLIILRNFHMSINCAYKFVAYCTTGALIRKITVNYYLQRN